MSYVSEKFLRSLNHSNPFRPRFEIGNGMDTQLTISHHGQCMSVPIAEVLSFARRWERDLEMRRAQAREEGFVGLQLFPYPIYDTNLDDPDVKEVDWGVPRDSQ